MKLSLQITGKIWLSTCIMLLGYLFSMVLRVVIGLQNIDLLQDTSDTRFPATTYSQRALSAFEAQMKLYEDAVMLGETHYVKQAVESSERARNALQQLSLLDNVEFERIKDINQLSMGLRKFTKEASSVYGAIAAGAEFTDALEEKMVELAQTKDTLKASLEKLVRSSSDELKTGLRNIIERTKSGQDLNLWTFVIAIAASSVIMQLAINRLITRPISKTVTMLEELGQGRLERRLGISTQDEIGRMARAMDEFADNLMKKVRLAEDIASGDLTVKVALASEYDTLGEAMNTMVGNLKAHQAAIESNIASLEMQAIALKKANDSLTNEISERKAAQAELAETQAQLIDASRQAGMAEVATGVLHNVGNVLNSVNVSATLVSDRVSGSQSQGLAKATALLDQNQEHIGQYISEDPRGKQLPRYLSLVSEKLGQERQEMLEELKILVKNIAHIKDIVSLQQSYAKVSGVSESVSIQELVADAININRAPIERNDISVSVLPTDIPQVMLERQKVLQILVNLVKNAADALTEAKIEGPAITINIESQTRTLSVHVADNGIGIAEENLTRVFAHGFTTKKTGHGFGLHTGALAATEMGGALRVESAGVGEGATFILDMPLVLAEEQHA